VAESQKARKLVEARALYAGGATKPVIAEALGVSLRTIQKWAREDAMAGQAWGREGATGSPNAVPPVPELSSQDNTTSADQLCRKLEERLARLIEAGDPAKDARLEDRMLKLCKVLESLRASQDDVAPQLEAMKRFASFCVRTLSEDEMSPVRKAIRLFLEDLRKEHS
jgi:hypothetical protein